MILSQLNGLEFNMCGIVGFCDFTKQSGLKTLKNMTSVLNHRGPDDEGHRIIKSEFAKVGIGHKRLSVLDLSANGHQPMSFKGLEIVYNGEIYNYKEIRNELIDAGYLFVSDTDTEVLLKAFHKWGLRSIDKLNGMFAFAIYDKNQKKLFLVRDRVGVKPLYFYQSENLVLFASELKSFHEHPNFKKKISNSGLSLYFKYSYIPEPYSIFEYTYKLKAGHHIEIDLPTGSLKQKKYWNVKDFYTMPKLNVSSRDAEEMLEALLISSFNYRTISDIPVGIFLSGGYDSSLVTALLKNNKNSLETFTIGFDDKEFDESGYAKKVSDFCGIPNNNKDLSKLDIVKTSQIICEVFDEPFGDGSALPTIILSQFAKKRVGVALSADGGDEIFAGYEKYQRVMKFYGYFKITPKIIRHFVAFVLKKIDPKLIPLLNKTYNFSTRYEKIINILMSKNTSQALNCISVYNTDKEVKSLIKDRFIFAETNFDISTDDISDNIDKMLFTDYKTYLTDNILVKVDRATMSASLEGRDPLLDHRIIELMALLPSEFKLKNNITKILVKKIVHKHIPKNIMNRPKKGFGIPAQTWLKDDLRKLVSKYLDDNSIIATNILDYKVVAKLREDFLKGKNESAHKIWLILVFQMWHEKWM